MGMSEGYRRIAEQKREKWERFNRRLHAVGLPEAKRPDFDDEFGGQYLDVTPRTRAGWAIYVDLREREGGLTPKEYDEIKYGLERILISEKEEEIRRRLEAGGTLPDPNWPDTSPEISAETALSQRAISIVHWAAIKELGLEKDEHYRGVYRSVQSEMYDISRQRGDFKRFFENIYPIEKDSDAGIQHAEILVDPVRVQLHIPTSVLPINSTFFQNIRYHPKYGLIVGRCREFSYYDRGASSYPGGRGSRVTDYTVSASLALPGLKLKNIMPALTRSSVWVVAKESGAMIGRWRGNRSIYSELDYSRKFSERATAERFLDGSIESLFFQTTLPVTVERSSDGHRLYFEANRVVMN
jgi:hypothetical protein